MKSIYRITLEPRESEPRRETIEFRGTMWQANRVFQSLFVALQDSKYRQVEIGVVGSNGACYQLNMGKLGSAEHGL